MNFASSSFVSLLLALLALSSIVEAGKQVVDPCSPINGVKSLSTRGLRCSRRAACVFVSPACVLKSASSKAPTTHTPTARPMTHTPTPVPTTEAPAVAIAYCTNTCPWPNDGSCDDGGGGGPQFCDYGSDCGDCGPRPGPNPGPTCLNTCHWHNDGQCDDGGTGNVQYCAYGTDCADCGTRNLTPGGVFTNSPTPTDTLAPSSIPYKITLKYVSAAPSGAQAAFNFAVAKWESVIAAGLATDGVIDANTYGCDGEPLTLETSQVSFSEMYIYVDLSYIDGPGKVLGQAGPCQYDSQVKPMPRVGIIQLDSADVDVYVGNGLINTIVLHEMGHILGIGTSWEMAQYKLIDSKTTYPIFYNGPGGIQGQKDVGGLGHPIVEDQGGPGTARGHWRDATYNDELMTGYINQGANPLSLLTAESLRDLMYTVDTSKADPYVIPSAGRRLRDPNEVHVHMSDCLWKGPVKTAKTRPKRHPGKNPAGLPRKGG
jgi:hypothetical protein